MQISNYLNQYMSNLSTGSDVSAKSQGVERLTESLQQLTAGQIFEGTVNHINGTEVILGLSSGQNLTARIERGIQLAQGQSVFFQVKSNDGETIQIRPVSVGGQASNPTLRSALSAASIPMTEATIKMVDEMMKNQMPIDAKNLTAMAREVATHPNADVSTLVTLKNLDLPVTKENISQLQNYKENQGEILRGISGLSDSIEDALAGMLEEVPGENASGGSMTGFVSGMMDSLFPEGLGSTGGMIYGEAAGPEGMGTANNLAVSGGLAGGVASDGILTADGLVPADGETFAAGSLGHAVSEEGYQKLNDTLQNDPQFRQQYPQFFDQNGNLNKNADLKELLSAVNSRFFSKDGIFPRLMDGNGLSGMDQTDAGKLAEEMKEKLKNSGYKELLTGALSEKYSLRPEKLLEKGSVDKLYDEIKKDMDKVSNTAAGSLSHQAAQTVQQAAADVRNNVDFIRQVNQLYTYVQIPLKMSGQNATGDLYVYRNKKNSRQKGDDDEVSAFLHFDLEHLGSTDISIKMRHKNVDTQFYMEDPVSYELIENNIHLLEAKLNDLGYNCTIKVTNDSNKVDFADDFLKQDLPASAKQKTGSPLRYSFDVRA